MSVWLRRSESGEVWGRWHLVWLWLVRFWRVEAETTPTRRMAYRYLTTGESPWAK